MNILANEEHREALQADLNEQNAKFVSSLKEEDQKKFEAVGECFKILKEANVPAYLFPLLPNPKTSEDAMWQYNNLAEFIKWENGKMTQESKKKICMWQRSFVFAFKRWLDDMNQKNLSFSGASAFFERCAYEYYNYIENQVEIPEITMIKEGKL